MPKGRCDPEWPILLGARFLGAGLLRRPWKRETGLINQEILARHLKGAASPGCYIAGPPAMMEGLH